MMVSALIEREQENMANPIRNGVFIAVVGPSGAGKDTVIAYAREHLGDDSDVRFVRRVITRPCDGASEHHDTLDDVAFAEAAAAGAFALTWEAHGLKYGIPADVDVAIANGRVVIANGSRTALPALRARYENVVVVEIVARPEILAERLARRGRESRGEVLARLARAADVTIAGPGVVTIDNSGEREIAGRDFVAVIGKAIAFSDVGRF
ncbi:phosphonate metabolism protein/1,5-bisphosphokinase (PRPP-forming) PhnN [Pseudaminobacter arsenicus]|uniref:Ribose 1,5-bisphosphate phosphokinase PhnN n=1 Tax=Borborobacter arsenicus TaxID=1851146 RepID=A0A432V8Q1_9HYPH|nr:phosphonate metabolism protein/1,5-bisphosphokinase (PRPP-forming) PhnN [Pseudaminobacter arsenicus]RUM98535.1 phosphonate metabolism protein/1,5-bisphosphokinase (PRPP-forming) PhnN [Pseudaminobacter arsenicus]